MSGIDGLSGGALGEAFIAKAKRHFSAENLIPVEIPEFADNGVPFRIWVSPMSVEEKDKIQGLSTDKRGNVRDGEFAARAVLLKAKDAEGNRLFTGGQLAILKNQMDTQIIGRIAKAIFGAGEDEMPDADELAEPSPPTEGS